MAQTMSGSAAPESYAPRSLCDVSDAIRQRKVSPVDVVSSCLERIERLQPRLNAFITVAADAALSAAETAAKDIEQGHWKGPLHGIPIGLKDFYDTAGLRTTAAFERFKNRVPANDAAAVDKLKRAGAIVIGKTNMHTLGMGTTGLESAFGPVSNPWNSSYIPGGSSSGSSAAVASGLCYATLDTDAIGSCRLPAACCGVVGYKGSYGSVDREAINGLTFKDIDVLVLPTTSSPTPTVERARGNELALSPELTMFANYYALPAISMRCGADSRGLPLGLQLVARRGDDASVLQLASQYEAATQFTRQRPIAAAPKSATKR
jgi:Asp-tRNA(Asn)/Glu-tRNA(Gln) amidotransferase A subunit family amidase